MNNFMPIYWKTLKKWKILSKIQRLDLILEEKGSMTSPVTVEEMELGIRLPAQPLPPKRAPPGPQDFTGNPEQSFKGQIIAILYRLKWVGEEPQKERFVSFTRRILK